MNKKDRNLHLTKKEENILSALTGRKVGGAALARELQLPRTTVDYLLRKLYAHGLIKRFYVGKKIMWTRETP